MPLKQPMRLPRNLNRSTSVATRSVAMKHCHVFDRRARRRKQIFVRVGRRTAKIWSAIISEFRIWMLIVAVGIILIVGGILLLSPFFDVRAMHIRRQDARIDPEEIQQTLSRLFNQRLILVTKSQVTSMLQAEYPDIERVEISKQYPSTLNVTVYLHPILAKVKLDDASTGSGSSAVGSGTTVYTYMTRSGLFVASPLSLTKSPLPSITITDWAVRPENRKKLLDPEVLQQIFLARDTLRRDFGLSTVEIVVFLRAREFHIRTNKMVLWFDLQSPLAVQFQRFRELLKAVSAEQVKEYADLRIADKIIYK